MNENSFWNLGVSSCLYGNFNDEFLKQLQQNDIHYTEISGGRNSFFKDIDFVKNADKNFKNALTYEVTINSIHLPFVPPSEVDLKQSYGEIYNNTIKIYTELIKASANVGIKYAVYIQGLE